MSGSERRFYDGHDRNVDGFVLCVAPRSFSRGKRIKMKKKSRIFWLETDLVARAESCDNRGLAVSFALCSDIEYVK